MHAKHGTIVRQIDLVFNGATVSGLTDGELVDRFMARRGPFAEAAFAGLGPAARPDGAARLSGHPS